MTRDQFLSAYAEAHRARRAEDARGDRVPRPLLIGEDNPYSARPCDALLPFPPRSAGARLCDITGLDAARYLSRFDRVNLCSRTWSASEARRRAGLILGACAGRPLVLLGERVASAFERDFDPFRVEQRGLGAIVTLPHPSGRSRLWNAPGAVDRARAALREAGVLPR